jgi:hypothetical protein
MTSELNEQTQAQASHVTGAPTSTPQPAELHTIPSKPELSATELQHLNEQRQYTTEMLASINGILNASSFVARAEIYCRFTMEQTEKLTSFGGLSGEQIEARYRELLRSQPATQQGEFQRQQQLTGLQQFVIAHRENLSNCQAALVNGFQRMPSDEEFRQIAIRAREGIAEIDHEIATGERTVAPPPPEAECHDERSKVFCIPIPEIK